MMNIIEKSFLSNMSKVLLNGKKIIHSFSGGVDSAVLLYLLNKYKEKFGYTLENVYFHHGKNDICQMGDINERFTTSISHSFDIDIKIKYLDLKKDKQGWEAVASKARKAYFDDQIYDFRSLAHHLDDSVENIMIQFMRGAGEGTRAFQLLNKKNLRPLYNCKKSDIYVFAKENNILYNEDPTNKNTDFSRNFWRVNIFPKLEEHYPQYREKILFFGHKQEQQHNLMRDLAVIDGLDNISNVDFNALSYNRIHNLLYFYLKEKLSVSVQDARLVELTKMIINAKETGKKMVFDDIEFGISLKKHKRTLILNILNINNDFEM